MSKLDLYKQHLLQIVQSASANPEYAEELTDQLLIALDEHFIEQNRFEHIVRAVGAINSKLLIMEEGFRLEGEQFYQKVKLVDVKEKLVEFYSTYRQAISNGNFPLACKGLFQQIETLVNLLILNRTLIDTLIRTNKTGYYFMEQKNGYYRIDLSNKIRVVSDYYKTEFSKLYTPYNKLNECYDRNYYKKCRELRNGDSHGMSFDQTEGVVEDLTDFATNYSLYVAEPIKLITYLLQLLIATQ